MKIYHFCFILSLFPILISGCTASPKVQKQTSNTNTATVVDKNDTIDTEDRTLKEEGPPLQWKNTEPVTANTKKAEHPKEELHQPPKKKETPKKKKVENEQPLQAKEPQKEPDPVKTKPPEIPKPKKDIIAEFEGVEITKETYAKTKSEIETVVDDLNRITATKNYNEWLKYISVDYKKAYVNPARLKAVSEALPIKGIELKSLKDYFLYVFVPSRQNIRVDDIHFASPTRVEVIMDYNNGRLLVYNIENVDGKWKIVPLK